LLYYKLQLPSYGEIKDKNQFTPHMRPVSKECFPSLNYYAGRIREKKGNATVTFWKIKFSATGKKFKKKSRE